MESGYQLLIAHWLATNQLTPRVCRDIIDDAIGWRESNSVGGNGRQYMREMAACYAARMMEPQHVLRPIEPTKLNVAHALENKHERIIEASPAEKPIEPVYGRGVHMYPYWYHGRNGADRDALKADFFGNIRHHTLSSGTHFRRSFTRTIIDTYMGCDDDRPE